MSRITLGAGCFWCVEAAFKSLAGVSSVVSGYSGGSSSNPTYKQVCGGDTGHAEVVQVTFEPSALHQVLELFWKVHDPTQLNRQGNDIGTQYRSVIFYHDEEQRVAAYKSKELAQTQFQEPIVTLIEPFDKFFPAEDYHQDYYALNKDKNPYCARVIRPKLIKLNIEKQ
jgi:peptide-methionine (S)-S-oxide reductase